MSDKQDNVIESTIRVYIGPPPDNEGRVAVIMDASDGWLRSLGYIPLDEQRAELAELRATIEDRILRATATSKQDIERLTTERDIATEVSTGQHEALVKLLGLGPAASFGECEVAIERLAKEKSALREALSLTDDETATTLRAALETAKGAAMALTEILGPHNSMELWSWDRIVAAVKDADASTDTVIARRDEHEDRLSEIADALGDQTEWTSANDRGLNALNLALTLKQELDERNNDLELRDIQSMKDEIDRLTKERDECKEELVLVAVERDEARATRDDRWARNKAAQTVLARLRPVIAAARAQSDAKRLLDVAHGTRRPSDPLGSRGWPEQIAWEAACEATTDAIDAADKAGVESPDPGHPHLINGEFQSDKYPTCPRGKVPLSVKDPAAQDLLWIYAERRRPIDAEFADDLRLALQNAGSKEPDFAAAVSEEATDSAIITGLLKANFRVHQRADTVERDYAEVCATLDELEKLLEPTAPLSQMGVRAMVKSLVRRFGEAEACIRQLGDREPVGAEWDRAVTACFELLLKESGGGLRIYQLEKPAYTPPVKRMLVTLYVVINGKETSIQAKASKPLSKAIEWALIGSHNHVHPVEQWDVRNMWGIPLDPSKTLDELPLEESRVFLTLKGNELPAPQKMPQFPGTSGPERA